MPRVAPSVPAETDLLCEGCGYVISGLPVISRCPECGKPIVESIGKDRRHSTQWDTAGAKGFLRTTLDVLFSPTRFFTSLQTRAPLSQSQTFAQAHWIIASVLFGVAGYGHANWYYTTILAKGQISPLWALAIAIAVYFSLSLTTQLAGKLTSWEATYRGLRIPEGVAMRGLHFHSAHYFPVGLISLLIIYGYQFGVQFKYFAEGSTATNYLYVLCGLVIVAAGYLFKTYWIGMRNIMFANR